MKRALAVVLLWILFGTACYGIAEEDVLTEEMNSQMDGLHIADFVRQAKEYGGQFMEDMDMDELLSSAIGGKVDNSSWIKKIFQSLGKEVKEAITTLRKYFSYYCGT